MISIDIRISHTHVRIGVFLISFLENEDTNVFITESVLKMYILSTFNTFKFLILKKNAFRIKLVIESEKLLGQVLLIEQVVQP